MKTLNIKIITKQELQEHWGVDCCVGSIVFIRCNAKGVVNWDKALVYSLNELRKKEKINVII